MKRFIFVNRFFYPDHSATSQILGDLTFTMAESGHEVHVITSRQLYDNPQANLPPESVVRGVHIHRVSSTHFGRSGLVGRGIDYLSFYISLGRPLRAFARRGDIIIAMTDPPLASVPAMLAAKRRGARLVNWLQDIYPEVAVGLNVPMLKGPVAAALSRCRDASLAAAVANVVVGQRMAEYLHSRGFGDPRLHVIHNWSDDHTIVPVDPLNNPLRHQWGLIDKFVVGYSGNLGRAHEFDTVLAAAERLRNEPRIVFVFIGGGHRMGELSRTIKARGLESSFQCLPYQERESLQYSLGVPDVHWISLKPEVEGLIVPSKFYGIAAAGRPVIAITAKDGEIARLVTGHKCGFVVEPGQDEALAAALVQLSTNADLLSTMGIRARQMLDTHFTRKQAIRHWHALLDQIDKS